MKKIILVFAVFMAFAATSFAYSDYLNISLRGVDYQTYDVSALGATGYGYSMGCFAPGYVELKIINVYQNVMLSDRCEYQVGQSGSSGVGYGQLFEVLIEVAVYDPEEISNGNGIYIGWSD